MSTQDLDFSAFSALKKSDWLGQIEKELRGKPFESMLTEIEPGIVLQPAYTKEDVGEITPLPPRAQDHLDLVEAVEVSNGEAQNKVLLDLLNRGASSLLLFLQEGVNLSDLLKDVLIQHISVHYVVEGNGKSILDQLEKIVAERQLDPSTIRGSINIDPFENLARTGSWFKSETEDLANIEAISNSSLTRMKTMCVNANIYHNSGGCTTTELAVALAHANEYLARFNNASDRIWMNLAIGRNYLVEIAKFRAMRLLWAKVSEAYNSNAPLQISAETGLRNKTIYDPNVNMLRTTTEALSAMVGGVDEVCVYPYDITFRESTSLAKRVARNQSLVMQYEAFATKVNDPAAGSYAIENLTQQLCAKAWKKFQSIEAQGGYLEALKSGFIQEMIDGDAADEQAKFDSGEITLVGTNKFPNQDEKMAEQVNLPLYSPDRGGEVVQRLIPMRLAQKMERERLNAEQS
ncbi:MAG: hypothetical protein HWD92_04260 [Flavobacteriia bacterium]|nr:hypothetical protein [Flavobacteriia bacterium]